MLLCAQAGVSDLDALVLRLGDTAQRAPRCAPRSHPGRIGVNRGGLCAPATICHRFIRATPDV